MERGTPMAQAVEKQNGRGDGRGKTLYERTVLGFRNYWYPACLAKDVKGRKPKAVMLLGDEVVLLRRQGKVYALANECPHRGTRLSRGKHEFPDTPTISCRYHGWTYDVTNGNCVAALTDGPDSPVVGKVRVKTYPVEERKGIVWVWMGKGTPSVPVEEDMPKLMTRDDTIVVARCRGKNNSKNKAREGNWRYHAENLGGGHFAMLHRDAVRFLLGRVQLPAFQLGTKITREDGPDGAWLVERPQGMKGEADYPGLGRWPRPRPWRKSWRKRIRPMFGFDPGGAAMRLPAIARIPGYPTDASRTMYYEWYVPMDETHYLYFQVTCTWQTNIIRKLWFYLQYHLYAARLGLGHFNDQDYDVVKDSTDYAMRRGGSVQGMHNLPMRLYRPDLFHLEWIRYCNETARGEASQGTQAKDGADLFLG